MLDRDEIREVIRGAYRIVSRIAGREIHVLTVLEGHRLPPRGVDIPADEPSRWRSRRDG